LLTEHITLLRAAFRQVRARHPFVIEPAVILPDHLHTIWTLPEHEPDFCVAVAPDQERFFTRFTRR